jgi:2-polyprenyl-6-methoxyphenol hydroxylase-like FAD-dependent oxidoreductase
MKDPSHAMYTSGETDPVWIHTVPYSSIPTFSKLDRDLETDVCIVGAGISGISTAYELVIRGVNVVLIEGREVLSGETGRTSGHLASDLDDGYPEIAKKHGDKHAKLAAESHVWALNSASSASTANSLATTFRSIPRAAKTMRRTSRR